MTRSCGPLWGAATFTAALGIVVAAPAYAYLTAGGSGTGTTGTGSLQSLTILSATGMPASTLTPGGTADLLLQVHNPNPTSVTLVSVAQGGGVSVVGGSGCTSDPGWPGSLGNSGVTVGATSGLTVDVPAGATLEVHLPAAAEMSTTSASGCQGAEFRVPVSVSVQQ